MERESIGLRLSRGYVKHYVMLFLAPACEVLLIEREPGASSQRIVPIVVSLVILFATHALGCQRDFPPPAGVAGQKQPGVG